MVGCPLSSMTFSAGEGLGFSEMNGLVNLGETPWSEGIQRETHEDQWMIYNYWSQLNQSLFRPRLRY